jgi:hypothetical protein
MDTEAAEIPTSIDITMPVPIVINGKETTDFKFVRTPTGNDLGRFTFMSLLDGDVKAISVVTPKIIQPYITPKIIKDMGPQNMMALTMAYNAFFEGVDMENMAKPSDGEVTASKPTPANSSSAQKEA